MRKGKLVAGTNQYCGPFAVGYCAGVSPDKVARYLSARSGRETKGMGVSDITSALRAFSCGSRVETDYPGDGMHRPTLREWFAQRSNKLGMYIVFVTGHFLVIHKQMLLDNHKRLGLLFKLYRHQHARVNMAWEIG